MQTHFIDPDLGMVSAPNLSRFRQHEAGGYLSVSNSLGLRTDEFTPERVDGRPRLVVLGDSFTMGTGVEASDRYSDRLAAALPGWDILNFGLVGSGMDQQLLLWRKHASGIEHDAVLLGSWAENIRRNAAKFRLWNEAWAQSGSDVVWMPKPYFELSDDGVLTLSHVPCPEPARYDAIDESDADVPSFNWLRTQLRRMGPSFTDRAQRLLRVQPLKEYDSPDRYEWRLLVAILEHFAPEIDRPFMFAPIPMHQHIEGVASSKAYRARIAELDIPGLTVFDALPGLRTYDDLRSMRFENDMHFSPYGHQAFADVLLPEVTRWLD